MISEAIKTNASSCTVEMWAKEVLGGPGRRTAETQLEAFQQKDHFPRCLPVFWEWCWPAGELVFYKEAGVVLPKEDTSTSPGPGSVQAGERWTLCYSTRKGGSSSKGIRDRPQNSASKKPVGAIYILRSSCAPTFSYHYCPFPLTWLKSSPSLWNELPSSSPWRVSIWHPRQRGPLFLFSRRKTGFRSMILRVIWKNYEKILKRNEGFNYRILETDQKSSPRFLPSFIHYKISDFVCYMSFGIWHSGYQWHIKCQCHNIY